MQKIQYFAVALMLFVSLADSRRACAEVIFQSTADGYVGSDGTVNTYGMRVGSQKNRVSTIEARGILEFDISSLAGQSISSATVSVRIASVGAFSTKGAADESLSVSLFGYAGDGAITGDDFSSAASLLDGPFVIAEKVSEIVAPSTDPSGPLTADLLLIVDVTAFVQSLIDSSSTMAAIRYQSAPLPTDLLASFVAAESGYDASLKPLLSVQTIHVPEPGSLTLWSAGLIGLAFARRRR